VIPSDGLNFFGRTSVSSVENIELRQGAFVEVTVKKVLLLVHQPLTPQKPPPPSRNFGKTRGGEVFINYSNLGGFCFTSSFDRKIFFNFSKKNKKSVFFDNF
jgi:hypothetical protein